MQFTCEKDTLNKALNIVSKAVSSRTTIPILKGILLQCEKESQKIFLSSSDLDISIRTGASSKVEEEGSIVVSAKLFSDIVRKLPAGEVSFKLQENDMVEVVCGSFQSTLQGISAEDFPRVETGLDGRAFSVEKSMLRDMIRATCFAASIEESRGIITGVLMEFKKDSFNMVALDGYRMAIIREKVRGEDEQNVVISARNMSEIGKLLSEEVEEADIEIRLGEKNAVFMLNHTKVVTRVMEGEFIKYNDILPKENRIKVKVNRREIMESVERASIVVREGKNSFIKFTLNEDEIVLFSRADEATTKESIKVEKEGDDLEIGFNARFMSDTLKAIDDEFIIMHFNTGINPCLITPQEGDAYEYLILPVRLSTVNV